MMSVAEKWVKNKLTVKGTRLALSVSYPANTVWTCGGSLALTVLDDIIRQ